MSGSCCSVAHVCAAIELLAVPAAAVVMRPSLCCLRAALSCDAPGLRAIAAHPHPPARSVTSQLAAMRRRWHWCRTRSSTPPCVRSAWLWTLWPAAAATTWQLPSCSCRGTAPQVGAVWLGSLQAARRGCECWLRCGRPSVGAGDCGGMGRLHDRVQCMPTADRAPLLLSFGCSRARVPCWPAQVPRCRRCQTRLRPWPVSR